jgi:hypothetical protein
MWIKDIIKKEYSKLNKSEIIKRLYKTKYINN